MKAAWGVKRVCPSCGVRFYDLKKRPIVCPACAETFPEQVFVRGRRGRSQEVAAKPAPVKPAPKAPEEAAATEDVDEAVPALETDAEVAAVKDPPDAVIEDVTELGNDEDDVTEVLENVEEPEKT